MGFISEFTHKILVTSSSTVLLLCCAPAGRTIEALFSSDAALLNFDCRTCFWPCLKEGLEDGNIPPDEPKALARARVIRTVDSSTLAAVLFSLSIFACLVKEQCMNSKWNLLHRTCTSKINSLWDNRNKQLVYKLEKSQVKMQCNLSLQPNKAFAVTIFPRHCNTKERVKTTSKHFADMPMRAHVKD